MKANCLKYISIPLLLIFVIACQEKVDKIQPETSCKTIPSVNANFLIKENVGDSLIETDTVLQYNYVTFIATMEDADSYLWQIGSHSQNFTKKNVQLLFTEAVGKVNVHLIVKKEQNGECSSDTLSKSFYVVKANYAPIIGKYEGFFESDINRSNKEVVELKYISPNEGSRYEPFGMISIVNINKGCNPPTGAEIGGYTGARAIYFSEGSIYYSGCKGPEGWIKLQGPDSISVEFTYGDISNHNTAPTPRIKDKFIGKRI